MRRVPIRLKLGAALATPLLLLFIVTALEVVGAARQVRNVRAQTDLAEAAVGPSGLITRLQDERRFSAVELVGGQGGSNGGAVSYDEVRGQTDQALTELRDEIAHKGNAVTVAFEPAFDELTALQNTREAIDQNTNAHNPQANLAFSQEIFNRYSVIIEGLFDATTRASLAVKDTELRRGVELADVAARQIDTMSVLIIDLYVFGSTEGINTRTEIRELASLKATFEKNADTMRSAEAPFSHIATDHYPTELTQQLSNVTAQAIATGTVDPIALSAATDNPEHGDYTDYQQAIAAAITHRADELNNAARERQRWFVGVAAFVVASATAVAWAVSRSITRPLRLLTNEATELAKRGLPDAIAEIRSTPPGQDVNMPKMGAVHDVSRDEVSDLVGALNTAHRAALDLAVEQALLQRNIADSFVNLGRRNQNLLSRQLDFITKLETDETHPDTLSSLYKLDHLATRMRRNAESLLVLAGTEPARRWTAPVRITDVIRSALGEVEDYQRVALRDIEPAAIFGSAAADLVHLLAELIENALAVTPHDRWVDIRGQHRTHSPAGPLQTTGSGPCYLLVVIDHGLGMTPTEIAAANRRLAGHERSTVAPSKSLGHYVAGQLAARHAIDVQLNNLPGAGVTATIRLPTPLLTTDPRPHPTIAPTQTNSIAHSSPRRP